MNRALTSHKDCIVNTPDVLTETNIGLITLRKTVVSIQNTKKKKNQTQNKQKYTDIECFMHVSTVQI